MTRVQRIIVSLIVRCELGLLLLQRGRPYSEFRERDPGTRMGVGLWELPGGGLDFGEAPLQAVVRETFEETGIMISKEDLRLTACCSYTLREPDRESHRIHIIYEVSLKAPLQARPSEEHVAFTWARDLRAIQDLPMITEVRDVIAARF